MKTETPVTWETLGSIAVVITIVCTIFWVGRATASPEYLVSTEYRNVCGATDSNATSTYLFNPLQR